jgi:hypothetical protein
VERSGVVTRGEMAEGLNMIARFYSDLDPSDARYRFAAEARRIQLVHGSVAPPKYIQYTVNACHSYGPYDTRCANELQPALSTVMSLLEYGVHSLNIRLSYSGSVNRSQLIDGLAKIARFYSSLHPSKANHKLGAHIHLIDLLSTFVPTPDHIVYTLHTSSRPASPQS